MSLIDPTRPAWRVLNPNGFFGPDDHLYPEGEEIYFEGEPNEELEPLNDSARQKLVSYLERLDNLGREAALKAGKAYAGRPRSLDGGLALATAIQRSDMNLMGRSRDEAAVERVAAEQIPETGSIKRSRGRPKKDSLAISA
jgi:hypothetical protein